MPAEPAPKNKILWSVRGVPAADDDRRAALRNPDRTTEPFKNDVNTHDKIMWEKKLTSALNLITTVENREKTGTEYNNAHHHWSNGTCFGTYQDIWRHYPLRSPQIERGVGGRRLSLLPWILPWIRPSVKKRWLTIRQPHLGRWSEPQRCQVSSGVFQGTGDHWWTFPCLCLSRDRWVKLLRVWYQHQRCTSP